MADTIPAKRYTFDELNNMSHADLYRLRNKYAANDPMQDVIAPFEHQAFAREWAQEQPVVAGASLPAAIPSYYVAKKVGFMSGRTEPSLDEIFAGLTGYAQGMYK